MRISGSQAAAGRELVGQGGHLRTGKPHVSGVLGRSRMVLGVPYKEGVGGSSPSAPTAVVSRD